MAVIVNDRDVSLQEAQERLSVITMQPNMQVGQEQVDGLGITLLAAKTVSLRVSSQVVVVNQDGTTTPSVVTLTPTAKNLFGGPIYDVMTGSAVVTINSDGSASINTSTMTTDTLGLRVSVIDSGNAYADEVTIVKVYANSYSVTTFLTNEVEILPADSLGNITSYASAKGQFKVYEGSIDVTPNCTFSVAPNGLPDGVSATINAAGAYSVLGVPRTVDTATVVFRARYHGIDYNLNFRVLKSRTYTRGPMTFYVPTVTNVWSDTAATAAANAYGGLGLNDVVTQYWKLGAWAETRFWNGDEWVTIEAVVDGNMLVKGTVGAREIAAESINSSHIKTKGITADRIDSRGLSIMDADGNVILAAGVPLSYDNVVGGPTADQIASVTLITATPEMEVNVNSATRLSGTPGWTTGVRSAESYSGGAYVSAIAGTSDKDIVFGLNTDPESANDWESIDFGWHLRSDGTLEIVENGVVVAVEEIPGGGGGGGDPGDPGPTPTYAGMLDTIGVNAACAYSTRRLRAGWTGAAMKVRRSSDGSTLDIGFLTNGEFDKAALGAFVGLSNGYVDTWYDQSGNNRHLTQSTASLQPRISLGGGIENINNKAAISGLGNNRLSSAPFTIPLPWTRFYVAKLNNVSITSSFPSLMGNLSSSVEQASYVHNGYLGMHGPSGSDVICATALANGAIGVASEVWKSVGATGQWNGTGALTANVGNATVNGLSVFASYTNNTEATQALIPEIIILDNEPSSSIISQFQAQMKAYWGTP